MKAIQYLTLLWGVVQQVSQLAKREETLLVLSWIKHISIMQKKG